MSGRRFSTEAEVLGELERLHFLALEKVQDYEREAVFAAEDVTDVVGVAPSPSAIGSLFKGRKDMEHVGFTTATRAEAHGRPLRVWKGRAA